MRAIFAAEATTAMLEWARARSAAQPRADPRIASLASEGKADRAPWISILRRYLLPRLVIPKSFGLPPVVACRGTSPAMPRGRVPCEGGRVCRWPPPARWRSTLRCREWRQPPSPRRRSGPALRTRRQRRRYGGPARASVLRMSPSRNTMRGLQYVRRRNPAVHRAETQFGVALRHDVPALQQKAPDLVDQRGALADQPVANAMQRLHVELLLGS